MIDQSRLAKEISAVETELKWVSDRVREQSKILTDLVLRVSALEGRKKC